MRENSLGQELKERQPAVPEKEVVNFVKKLKQKPTKPKTPCTNTPAILTTQKFSKNRLNLYHYTATFISEKTASEYFGETRCRRRNSDGGVNHDN